MRLLLILQFMLREISIKTPLRNLHFTNFSYVLLLARPRRPVAWAPAVERVSHELFCLLKVRFARDSDSRVPRHQRITATVTENSKIWKMRRLRRSETQ
jgi:hypothetical protein